MAAMHLVNNILIASTSVFAYTFLYISHIFVST